MAHGPVLFAAVIVRGIIEFRQMLFAVAPPITRTRPAVLVTGNGAARRARHDLIASKDHVRLVVALAAMFLARQPPGAIGTAEVLGTMNLLVHSADRLVIGAYILVAARAPHSLVSTDGLITSALTVDHTLAA